MVPPDVTEFTAFCSALSVETVMTLPVGADKGGALHARVIGGVAEAFLADTASKLSISSNFRNLNI
jgi:hypothetical protein